MDRLIVKALKEVLEVGELKDRVEDDLRNAYNLSDDWDHDDQKWDNYREAVAVSLLRMHRDKHPDNEAQ